MITQMNYGLLDGKRERPIILLKKKKKKKKSLFSSLHSGDHNSDV